MRSRLTDTTPRWLAALALSCACSSSPPPSARDVADANDLGRVLAAETDTDRELLRQLPNLPIGNPRTVGNASVVADAPYAAASGRTCRSLRVTHAAKPGASLLACSAGGPWFFVPDVFASSTATD